MYSCTVAITIVKTLREVVKNKLKKNALQLN